jgi:hypothetical protein
MRGSTSTIAICTLIWEENGNTYYRDSFTVEIDNQTLQNWGSDDTVIDNIVLEYSPLFVRRNP